MQVRDGRKSRTFFVLRNANIDDLVSKAIAQKSEALLKKSSKKKPKGLSKMMTSAPCLTSNCNNGDGSFEGTVLSRGQSCQTKRPAGW